MRAACIGLIGLLAGFAPAHASGNFQCEIDDPSLRMSASSTVSHGLGGAFLDFEGTVKVLLKEAPGDWASFQIDKAHLVHHWFSDGELALHLYRERDGDAPHGYVELIVKTRQSDDDETAYAGTYELVVYDVGPSSDRDALRLEAKGNVSCSVG